ncbi:MAG: lamin tail domain-containing protein [Nostoc sp. ChiQUE02]|uniref:lamin tail domain-containing protein n=1 Tax=Nostoc sp. ChiQUE02 TaxID=3075377 RepID=UPI002AD4B838|nr:lamin tail domain-containing protein [Nostoc sp. ChiQUE02]MDZ8231362.1 lamin tail domain-containing protein [Nostoc sp. ChiQUE02]
MKSSRKGAKAQRRTFVKGKLLGSFAFVLCALGQGIQPSWAEGSKELVADGGYRPYLEWASTTTAGITRQTTLQVYVQAGEIVNLGSSVPTSANSNKDIVYRSPLGGQNGSCDVLASGFGLIDTLTKELAGPLPSAGGYSPCSFTATETGIYTVEFHAPSTTNNPPPRTTTAAFPTDSSQNGGVAAWDITVRDSNGVAKKGRVFTNYIAMNMGGNAGQNGAPADLALNSKLYIQTKDGYRYETDMNGVDPFGFIFFANNRGYLDKTNNSTLYRSAGGATDNNLNFAGNVRVQDPSAADTATDITHLVFFNRPDTITLSGLGIPLSPIIPAAPTNFQFTGANGGSGNQTYVGVGGYFSFNSASSGSYQIIIDTNNDGIYDPSSDRVLQNILSSGSNVVVWDGKDANGINLQPLANNASYNAQITTRAGEYHFPMLDAENNPLGFKITMENPPATFPNLTDQNGQQISSTTVYYNDNNYTTANGTSINLGGTGATNPRNASRGINSATGEHEFSSIYGDFKGIDTWTYFPSQAVLAPLVITANKQANVKGTKSVRFLTDNDGSGTVTVGDSVEYTITYSNLNPGNSDAINFVIYDSLPSQLTFVSKVISTVTAGNNITLNPSYNGSGAVTNSGTLRVGDTIIIKITATINDANGGNSISNQASAEFNTPDNPTGTVGKVFTDADSAGGTTNSPTPGNNFLQTTDDKVNLGNDPSKTDDDDPTLFTALNALNYQVSPLAGKVIINEVLYNETGNTIAADTNDEFIELYNASASAVDLSGVKLTDGNLIVGSSDGAGGFSYTFPNGTTLQPGQYAVIWIGNNKPNQQATAAAFQTWLGQTPKLNNSGDDIWLYDNQNKIIDYVAYGAGSGVNAPPPSSLNLWDNTYQSSLAGSSNGQSISLTPNGQDSNSSACWEASTSKNASARCPNYLPTRDTDTIGSRITSVGENNNGAMTANAKLLLIKRITRINNQDLTDIVDGRSDVPSNAANYVPEPYASDDSDDKWPAGYLRGLINAGTVKPGDEVEYTIYFLSKGPSNATNVKFCDLVPSNTTFLATAFNGQTPGDGGLAGADQGIALAVGSNTPTVYLSNIQDASDRGRFYPANDAATPSQCGINTNGAVTVDITRSPILPNLPAATGSGTPANSYGFVRFRAKVK